jgi:selenocysteine-specific elongation factor
MKSESMKNVVIGTAGHIDHGKTALVKALTGTDTDRLEEEKRRGITIDLGFAYLPLGASIEASFVDVPGHERFVKNMLAGAGGIDLVLLVVAADESIKPQTREHFDICRLLRIPRGVIALTKADLVDRETLDLVRMEIAELTAGSFLEGAPVVPVSSTTGIGLEELRRELARAAEQSAPRDTSGFIRLPVDRAFSMKGFGTVVTGTLISGTVETEQELEVYPAGLRVRVRGVQVHGTASERAVAGQRTALNLAGVDAAELRRGNVLSEPGAFRAVQRIDCRLQLLPTAKPLKHRAPVHFHSGAAEIEAEVQLLEGAAEALQPGESRWVRIVLREPALLLPGDRFIIRMFSPVTTIGGGVVTDVSEWRYRKGDDIGLRLSRLASEDLSQRIAWMVRERPFGAGLKDLSSLTGLTEDALAAAAERAPVVPLRAEPGWYADREWLQAKRAAIVEAVRGFHHDNPLAPGVSRAELRSRVLPDAPPFIMEELLAASDQLTVEGEFVRLRGREVRLKDDERLAREAIERIFEQAGLATPSLKEALQQSGVEPARARTLFSMLLRERKLIRVGEDLVFHHSAIDGLRALLAARKGERLSVPRFKDLTGVSRKYAIPLLEFLDRERVTRRDGSERVVL